MTHIAIKYPLEKLQSSVLIWLQAVTLRFVLMQAWARRVWAAMINETTHHGGGLLLNGDSLRCQSSLAVVLGGSDHALILQKLHEWIEYNRTEGHTRNKRNGAWWTYNSYTSWRDEHFGWLSDDAIGRRVRDLEKLGVIRTQQLKRGDRRKWYTIDYARLNALLKDAKINAAMTLAPVKARRKAASLNEDAATANDHAANSHDDSSSESQAFKPNVVTQSSTNGPSAKDTAGAARKANDGLEADAPTVADFATVEADFTTQDTPDGGHQDSPIPRSEAPLTQADAITKRPMDPVEIWETARHQLKLMWDEASYTQWLKPATFKGYALVDGVGIYRVRVPSEHAKDQLQHRYYRKVENIFRGLQHGPVSIRFEVM